MNQVQLLVPCPKCGSRLGDPCRMPNGKRAWPHQSRSIKLAQVKADSR